MNTNNLNFASFIQEGMFYVDSNTPTIINAGGCGIFAKMFYNECIKNAINCKIFCIAADPSTKPDQLLNFIKTNGAENKKYCFSHIFCKIEDILFVDAEGINANVIHNSSLVEISYDDLCTFLEKDDKDWNPIFDRDCIPTIEKLLDEVFDHLESYHPGIFNKIPKSLDLTDKTVKNREKIQMMRSMSHFSELFG